MKLGHQVIIIFLFDKWPPSNYYIHGKQIYKKGRDFKNPGMSIRLQIDQKIRQN